MKTVVGALAAVLVLALLAAGFGFAAGLSSDLTAGVEGRPLIYWMIGPAFLGVSIIYWPTLISWFVDLDLPLWLRNVEMVKPGGGGFQEIRAGRRVLVAAGSVDPRRRLRLAGGVLGYGLFSVLLSIPVPLMFGIAAMRRGPLRLEEALPLLGGFWIPVVWTAALLVRQRRRPLHSGVILRCAASLTG
jgi:hypothetical protein